MIKTTVYNFVGEETKQAEMSDKIFKVVVSPKLVTQLVNAELSNKRNTVGSTKTRGLVRGGGRKPWKQKGTGRARVGSIRSPLWRGGGTIFGPSANRNFKKNVNRPQFRKGLFAVLTQLLEKKNLHVVTGITQENIKTKELDVKFKAFCKKVNIPTISLAVVISSPNKSFERSARNLDWVEVLRVSEITPYRLLKRKNVLVAQDAIAAIEKRFLK
ncbi:MAG: 50S ribosomal protein L4 [Candidatus Doudnabacteria bacterium CG10_big_fil_rev_8_21_14_0_10_41_10]|uniref:Large ribosomal subunit protein uL4 n=1 Tax=Candidatus Doudnabacteria bacterium CG10_big_fil_rev_8_21_14_0_10_41_10 TaxID=1974551 RepID=A0A2H0VDE0_9BACT|nr:MAG: 50S ribosomal protein L4 [Candidatus Doudnabacteria bacterium CG10_big_fil_rev_8_21_14_0_10_41_10]